jgi:Na+-transporting methylmalonyl-CoA/oxaloacetate decarboxylase gamma subunit
MDRSESRRTNTLALLFLFFLALTVWCLHSLLVDSAASAPAPTPAVEVAAVGS